MAVLTSDYQKIGEKYLGSSYGDLYIRIYAKCNSQNIDNNTSSVSYQSRLYFSGSYIISQGNTQVVTSGTSATTTTTGWQNFEGNTSGKFWSGETIVKTITATVSHDNDTGVASISASAVFSSSGSWGWSGTASGTADLPTIPRGSTITATSAYIGETSQLTVTRYNDNYTHSIAYAFSDLSGYILANGSTTSTETKITATSIGFPIPTSWYAKIPNTTSGVCTLSIKTYNGNTQIGVTRTATFNVRVNESTNKPTVTASVIDTNNTTVALTGNSNYLVMGNSNAKITWSATPKNNATISNVKINGTTVSSSPTTMTFVGPNLSVVATDSRGLATSYQPSFTLVQYFNPTLVISSIYRANPTDNYATIKFNGTWFNHSFGSQSNSLTITWKYRETGTSNWTNGGTLAVNSKYKISGNNFYSGTGSSASETTVGGSSLSYEKNWDVAIVVTDALKSIQVVGQIAKGIPIINWGEDFFNVNGDIRKNNTSIIKPSGSIKAKLASAQSIAKTTNTTLNMNTLVYNSSGGKLTLSSGGVAIGSGVNEVIVNGRWTAWDYGNYGRYVYIYKNENAVAFNNLYYNTTTETTVIIPVEQGDIITVRCYHENSSALSATANENQTFIEVAILS